MGRFRPEAPTDPYVLALEHTVLQIMGLLRVWAETARSVQEPRDSGPARGKTFPRSLIEGVAAKKPLLPTGFDLEEET